MRRRVCERYDIQQQKRTDRRLIEEKLHAVQVELLVIRPDPDSIQRACQHARKREEHSNRLRGLDLDSRPTHWPRVVIRHHDDATANRDEAVHGSPRDASAIEQQIDDRGQRCQQYPDDLIECHG